MVNNSIPNQNNFQDIQDFDIDIEKLYNDFILAIDKIRSYNNMATVQENTILNDLNNAPDVANARAVLLSRAHLDKINLQESRCHAFFRIIGFPVCGEDKTRIFNPGLDLSITDKNRTVNDVFKLTIIKSSFKSFRKISLERERYVNKISQIFSQTKSIDASTLALSSGFNIRSFLTFKTDDPFDVEIKSQQYAADFTSLIGINITKLTEYVDISGNTPKQLSQFSTRAHIIKPFLVDPIIDLTVNDSTKLVSVPFVSDKSKLKIVDNKYVSRPLIEQIIRDRFVVSNQNSSLGTADQSIIDYIKNVPAIADEEVLNSISDIFKLSDDSQFIKFFNIIRSMTKKLIQSQHDIQIAISSYYWVPSPSTTGPEGGSAVQGVFLSSSVSEDFITSNDQDIINAQIRSIVNSANNLVAPANGTPDVGGFAFDSFKTTFGPDTSTGLGDNSSQNLDSLVSKRNVILKKANDALRLIEIIMGEFSGFGLCDIIAILGALYIMPKEQLLGFLDIDALARMNKVPGLSGTASTLEEASIALHAKVKDFYILMDTIYEYEFVNNGQI